MDAVAKISSKGQTVYVLESFYEAPRGQVAEVVRSLLALVSVVVVDPPLILRAIEVYETDRLDFAEAYLVACAESTGVGRVASFDRSVDRARQSNGSNPASRDVPGRQEQRGGAVEPAATAGHQGQTAVPAGAQNAATLRRPAVRRGA